MTTITLRYADVKRDVLRLSEYAGRKAGQYDRLRAIDEDDEQLRRWYADGLVLVGHVLDRLLPRTVSSGGEGGEHVLTLSGTTAQPELLSDAVREMVVSNILYRWVKLVAPPLAESYMADLAQAKDKLERIAYYRKMPQQ